MDGLDSSPEASPDAEMQEDAPEPAPVDIRHECEMPAVGHKIRDKIYYVKLPNFLSIDTREYDPNFYEDEIDEDEQLDNEGRAKMKLKVENTIRWRKVEDEDGNQVNQSNARMVEWSDGSRSLYLGSEIFDVNEKSIGDCNHLYIRQGMRQGLQGQAIFHSKLSIRPNSTESFTHRKLTLSLADRSQKTQKIRMLNNPGQDPEARLNELSKKEDEKLKATMRRETKQRMTQERAQHMGPSASYLEDDEDDDENISISAIKKRVNRRYNDDQSDESSESDEYSSESDPEFGKVQTRKVRRVVDDSDSD